MSLTDQQIAQLSSLLASLKQRVSDPLSCCDDAKTAVATAEDLLAEVERLRAERVRVRQAVDALSEFELSLLSSVTDPASEVPGSARCPHATCEEVGDRG